jgi:hypothetical protein
MCRDQIVRDDEFADSRFFDVGEDPVMTAVTIDAPRSPFGIRFPLVVPGVKGAFWSSRLFHSMQHCFFASGQSGEGVLTEGLSCLFLRE